MSINPAVVFHRLGGRSGALAVACLALVASADVALGQATKPAITTTTASARQSVADQHTRAEAQRLMKRSARYLIAAQDKDGGWDSQGGPGISALVLKALIQEPAVGPRHRSVQRGVEFILRFQRDDGSLHSAEGLLKNYESSVALSMLAALKDPAYQKQIAALQEFLKKNQWDEGEGKSIDDPWYGGAGYGRHQRPDLSNTQMMLEALHESGLSKDDPVYKKAMVFVQRCQMLGETNDQPFARGSTQGGFIYTPHNGGESKAGTIDVNGKTELRCYGSISYAAFKSMLFAGLERDDPRVQAALGWFRQHWTLAHNPNLPERQSQEGIFYYYHVFGRALDAWGEPLVKDIRGRSHHWRRELVEELARRQRPDGSWVNEADRWMEGLPSLTTAYAMLALQAAYPTSE